ncbi:protein kinase [Brevundimonas sp. BAL450]|uniref:protein kinase domain-containing protein n=1 Tax=Brevundimonas TaxID=41275 RepID=UPI00130EAE47|nr:MULTISPECIES: serine/threonine-protein kinase [Brevundimonas]MBG7613743.1 protein kinase [Brevundimonas sp. BAL450]
MAKPIEQLSGLRTSDGWVIGELVKKQAYQTGGCFSVGYLVQHEENPSRVGFLKALDFSRAQEAEDQVRALEDMTRTYNFERDVLALCRGANLDRVVVAIADGSIAVPDAPFGTVSYLIFELADGDVRKHAVLKNEIDAYWSLNALHQIATGLNQLHAQGIFHQDLKPSNVLTFSGGATSKLADLGRSHCRTIASPHEMMALAGQPYYASPEFLYHFLMPDQARCRAASELYLFGSMLYYFFTGAMLTPTVISFMRPEHKPQSLSENGGGWEGTYEDVLPYFRAALADALGQLKDSIEASLTNHDPKLAAEIFELATYLSEPDPQLRGHPASRRRKHGNPYEMTRFISAFDRFVKVSEIRMKIDAASI